jgi:hypothetical protein
MYFQKGKCPKCNATISKVTVESVEVEGSKSYKGLSYLCPSCDCVLSVQIDPLAVNAELLASLKRG